MHNIENDPNRPDLYPDTRHDVAYTYTKRFPEFSVPYGCVYLCTTEGGYDYYLDTSNDMIIACNPNDINEITYIGTPTLILNLAKVLSHIKEK